MASRRSGRLQTWRVGIWRIGGCDTVSVGVAEETVRRWGEGGGLEEGRRAEGGGGDGGGDDGGRKEGLGLSCWTATIAEHAHHHLPVSEETRLASIT